MLQMDVGEASPHTVRRTFVHYILLTPFLYSNFPRSRCVWARTPKTSLQLLMVAGPYKEPMGMDSEFCRALLCLFGEDCLGNRMLEGERLWRNGKVANVILTYELQRVITVKADVKSQNPLLCREESGRYFAMIQVLPFTHSTKRRAIKALKATSVWHQLLERQRTSLGITPVLAMKGSWGEPSEMMKELVQFLPQLRASNGIQASCHCSDFTSKDGDSLWCKHVASLCYALIDTCGSDPLSFMCGMGLDIPRMLKAEAPPSPNK